MTTTGGFPFKTVLVTGATSGIGMALTQRLIENGVFVIAVGRRRERLDALVAQHGSEKVGVEEFDLMDVEGMKEWVGRITTKYPSLDAILLNAGLQNSMDFTRPESISLPAATAELTTNYIAPLHLTVHFLPHLLRLSPNPAAVILIGSGLSLVPAPRCPGYCASKAAVHSLAWTVRNQMAGLDAHHQQDGEEKRKTDHVRIIEIVPPAVRTELHTRQRDVGKPMGMDLGEFLDEAWEGLKAGREEILVGDAGKRFGKVDDERRKVFGELWE